MLLDSTVSARCAPRASFALAILGLVVLASCSLLYMMYPSVADRVEAAVSAVALAWRNGQPLYHALDAPERYSQLHGPVLYAYNRLWVGLISEPVLAGKVGAAFCCTVGLAALFRSTRPFIGRGQALRVTGFAATFLLAFNETPIGPRGDAILFALAGLSVAVLPLEDASRSERILRSGVLGVLLGLAMGVKLHAGVYFIPVLLYVAKGADPRLTLSLLVATSAASFLAPFASLDQVSLELHLAWLLRAAGHPHSFSASFHSLLWFVFLVAPLAGTVVLLNDRRAWLDRNRLLLQGVVLSAVGVLTFSSKVGAGRHFVIPFVPIAAWLWARALGEFSRSADERSIRTYHRGLAAGLAILLVFGVFKMQAMFADLEFSLARSARSELATIIDRETGRSLAVGYGEPESFGYLRFLPVALGHPYLLDSVMLMDLSLTGRGVGERTLGLIDSCVVQSWVQPAGSPPFTLANYYFPAENVFGQELPRVFEARYAPAYSTEHFTVWRCEGPRH